MTRTTRLTSIAVGLAALFAQPARAEVASIYLTPANEAKIMALYDAKLAKWPVPYESVSVPTRYGRTHVLASGPKEAPPLLLLHAMGVTGTMWQPNVEALSRDFRVYAVDTIGDLGKSTLDDLSKYPSDSKAYSAWLGDVLDGLGLAQANVVGASMGGWIAMNLTRDLPQRVRRLALVGPMGLNSAWDVLFRMSWLVLFPTKGNKDGFTRWVLGDNPVVYDAFGEYMNTALDCRMKLGTPTVLKDEELAQVRVPTLVLLGGKDSTIGDAQKAAERAKRHMPQAETEIFPASGHLINTEHPAEVSERLRGFFRAGS